MADISLNKSFVSWKEHLGGNRVDTEVVVQEFLRESYPGYHVTRAASSSYNLFGFASAGFATASKPKDPKSFVASRVYEPPGPRIEKKTGKLQDTVHFGRWNYEFQGTEFLLYEITYSDHYGRLTRLIFVLAPEQGGGEDVGTLHHPATDALLLAAAEWSRELHDEIYVFDDGSWDKDSTLYESVQGASWEDVILNPTMKAKLVNDVQSFFDNRDMYRSLKVPWKRGVILHGFPGNGKTISIKALINTLSQRPEPIPSLYVKSFDSCRGAKWSIERIFSHARLMAPCLLIFEDLDSLVGEKTRSYFLNEVDGLESNEGILMIGSTNHLDRLDPAITKRPSRFDRKYHFRLPLENERTQYCRYWSRKFVDAGVGSATAVDFPDDICPLISKMTEGFSFAYLKELFVTSLLLLARENVGVDDNGDGEFDEEGREKGVDLPSGGSSCTDEAVVVEKEPEAPPAKAPKRIMPTVEIPTHLATNKLLCIVEAQAKVLLEEMDSIEDEDSKSKPKKRSKTIKIRTTSVDSSDDD